MLSKDFEIYYYNDKVMSPVKPHAHNYYEFYFFLEGDMDMCIGDEAHRIQPADFVLIPPNTSHYPRFIDAQKPYRRFVLWVSRDYLNELMQVSKDYGYLMQHVLVSKKYVFHTDPIDFNAIQSMIFGLIEEIKSDRFARDAEITLRLGSLLIFLNRMIYDQNSDKTFRAEKALYLKLCDYINENPEENLSLDALAEKFYVSKYYISHAFKSNIGISIHQYITKKRLQVCREAILGNETISSVYERYGFRDYSSFYRAFKKEYGISPKEFKNKYEINENIW
ncbi:AraC family transcriptional regulator [Konateibacter massiliensis]|uniref:AraC family transcriptional regulator n=1 Tax=Konateibacter massiliensis TaxID=2002841 RepID=UPI002E25545D